MILFDHVAIAAPRLADAPAVLAARLGGVPAYGGASPPYRFFQWRFAGGGRIEVLEPSVEESFLHRFLAQHGAGVHHVTFKVPSLAEACARAAARGYRIVGFDDSDPEWAEAFLHPKEALGIVVQMAETRWEPGPDALASFPPPPGPASPPPAVTVLGLRMRARSRERADRQWAEVLGGEPSEADGALVYRWPGSPMRLVVEVDARADESPVAIEYAADRPVELPDGPAPLLGAVFSRVAAPGPGAASAAPRL
jgi:methylmalonyl-CoA/ethylmalonyl-CoA epimerase